MIQGEAPLAGHGAVLFRGCNADVDYLCCSRGASREAVVRAVATLGKDAPFAARHALRRIASQLAEPINITLLDH